jgi:hypothetical protein
MISREDYKEPKVSPCWDFFGIGYMSKESEDERRRYKLTKVNIPLPNERLRSFEDKIWFEERLLVTAKKNKKRRIVEEGSSSVARDEGGAAHQANKQPHGGIPLPQPYE